MDTTVEVHEIGKKYGDKWGLKRATFNVKKGELLVLVGPNGAGKTTTVNILTTNLKPTRGYARILGYDILREYKEIRKQIAYMPQEFVVGWDHTPFEVVTWNLVARGWSISDAKNQARRWLELVGLWEARNKPLRILSGGQRRRATVATILATEAEVFFLDEPTVGLDVKIRNTVWKAIRETVKGGASIILTTHDMKEAQTIADKVVLINDGVTIVEDEPYKLVESMPYKYRVVIEKVDKLDISEDWIDLGDRIIVYAKNYNETVRLIEKLGQMSRIHMIDRVSLEDAYLKLISGDKDVKVH
ncbi:MAG: ABC transporter ATP-binding protein [Thermoprotei archaeon]|nr:MAG: ABC transporter ATP-binding protein [Thermofilum sp. ex4484_79]RLF06436.1 MAG: ABC transporter ATP-binding protein [Thermoprotei archaeon]